MFLALFVLGLVQGLTEFLPVSSSGHLVLLSKLFNIDESLFISILLHIATLLSIVVMYHKDVWRMIRHPLSGETILLVVATIPTCIIVLILMPLVKMSFMGSFLPVCFALTALLLYLCEIFGKRKRQKKLDLKTAFIMGVAQGFAVFPGISRSGTTVGAGICCGGESGSVTKFSFLMSIPVILLSLLMEVVDVATAGTAINIEVLPTLVSFVTAFLVGIVAIKFMTKLAEKSKLHYFSLYLVALAIISLFVV